MSLSTSDIHNIFAVLGKGMYLASLIDDQVADYEALLLGLVGQINSGNDADFDTFQNVALPANVAIKAIITKIQSATDSAKSINENYLTLSVSLLVGLFSPASVSDVLDAIRSQMIANTQYITPGGGIDTYIRTTWNYTAIPTTGSVLVNDSLITGAVV